MTPLQIHMLNKHSGGRHPSVLGSASAVNASRQKMASADGRTNGRTDGQDAQCGHIIRNKARQVKPSLKAK